MPDDTTFIILAFVWLYGYLTAFLNKNVEKIEANKADAPDKVLYMFEAFFAIFIILSLAYSISLFYSEYPITISFYTFFCTLSVFLLDLEEDEKVAKDENLK